MRLASCITMAANRKLNVQSFPRPPLLEKTPRHIQIKWHGQTIADTKEAYWVLETHHPPTYYLPPSSLTTPISKTARSSYCEWKGRATYYALQPPRGGDGSGDGSGGGGEGEGEVRDRAWSYDSPTRAFEPIRGYLSFYAGPWQCYVDGERVEAQPGDFYGGWVTGDVEGIVKGRTGNLDPAV